MFGGASMSAPKLASFKPATTAFHLLSLTVLILALINLSLFARPSSERQAPAAKAAGASAASDERLLSIGKKLFMDRCASCHNERGDKPLASGLPLNQRKLENADVERAVRGRLKNNTAEQQRAVALYIESFLQ